MIHARQTMWTTRGTTRSVFDLRYRRHVRILMVVWDLQPHAVGGVGGHVRGLSRSLGELGHDVVVLTTGPHTDSDPNPRVVRANVDLPWIPEDDVLAFTASANNRMTAMIAELGDFVPDVIHAHDWSASWCALSLAQIFAVPVVTTFHSTERSRHGGFVPPGDPSAVHSVESWLALAANEVICCSRFMTREATDAFELLPDHVHLVPNGIDVSQWQAMEPSTRENIVLAWGRVQYEKGFQILARAMTLVRATLPGVRCIIAGRGPYSPELQSQIDIEGVNDLVQLAGYVSDDQLRELLHTAGCVVIPSLYEPYGIVALESLAAGAPTIVARTGGLAEIMEGTSAGLLFEPGNSVELADRIIQALSDEELANSLRNRGPHLVQSHYTWDAVADRTLSVYQLSIDRPELSAR